MHPNSLVFISLPAYPAYKEPEASCFRSACLMMVSGFHILFYGVTATAVVDKKEQIMRRVPGLMLAVAVLVFGILAAVGLMSGAGAQDASPPAGGPPPGGFEIAPASPPMPLSLSRAGKIRRSTAWPLRPG